MEAQHAVVIHLIDVVTGETGHIVRIIQIHEADVLINGVCRTLIPYSTGSTLVRGQDVHAAMAAVQLPRLAVTHILVQLQRTILGQHTHRIDAGVGAVGEGEVDNAELTAEGDGGFGHVTGQHVQTAALSTCQEHCDAFFFHASFPPVEQFVLLRVCCLVR